MGKGHRDSDNNRCYHTFFFKPIIIQQESMQPTFYSNDYVVVSKQSYSIFGDIERGDVIVFRSSLLDENGDQKSLIKRVIGIARRYDRDKERICDIKQGDHSGGLPLPNREYPVKWSR